VTAEFNEGITKPADFHGNGSGINRLDTPVAGKQDVVLGWGIRES
jgi:hypothetical protein